MFASEKRARGCDNSLWEWEINHRPVWLPVPCGSVISDAFPGVWITLWRDHKTAVYITDYRRFSTVFTLQTAAYFPIPQWIHRVKFGAHPQCRVSHVVYLFSVVLGRRVGLEAQCGGVWQTAYNFSLQGSSFRWTVKILFRPRLVHSKRIKNHRGRRPFSVILSAFVAHSLWHKFPRNNEGCNDFSLSF